MRVQSREAWNAGDRVCSTYVSASLGIVDEYNLFRSKDAIVNIWNLPNPPAEPSRFAEQPGPPLVIDYFARPEQGDLTSLHWNADGSLLAVGSYDAVLRICSASGGLYFSNPQHSVNMIVFSMSRTSDCSFFCH